MAFLDIKSIYKLLIFNTIILVSLTINLDSTFCQVADYGQNPPTLNWKEIESKNFKIIFPEILETQAQKTINLLEHIYEIYGADLGVKARKTAIILHNQGVISNGFVLLAPRRSEFFITPPPDQDASDWLELLGVHEFRHVVQMDNSRRGFSKVISFLFGEEATLALFGITLPPWFFEGDAVHFETVYTNSGRGRLPEFQKDMRARTVSLNNPDSYQKASLGSFTDHVPDQYRLGYFMTTYIRKKHSDETINLILKRTARFPFIPYSFSNSVKRYTGLSTSKTYSAMISELKSEWDSLDPGEPTKFKVVNMRKSVVFTDYKQAIEESTGSYLCLKSGKSTTAEIIRIDSSGNEKSILKLGPQTEESFNYSNGKIVWTEIRYDKRWDQRSWSVVNIMDLESGKKKQLTHRSRIFSPALSSDAKKIACIDISLGDTAHLSILNSSTGEVLKTFSNPNAYFLQYPCFVDRDRKIVVVISGKQGKSLLLLDAEGRSEQTLLPFSFQNISRLSHYKGNVVFSASWSGIDNIYRYELITGNLFRLSNSTFGAYDPSFTVNGKLLYADYGITGLDIGLTDPIQKPWIFNTPDSSFINYSAPLIKENLLSTIPDSIYSINNYQKAKHLINIHSLSPFLSDINSIEEFNTSASTYQSGFKLKSTNLLNTFSAYVGYTAQNFIGFNDTRYYAGISYKAFYPIIDLQYSNQKTLIETLSPTDSDAYNLIYEHLRNNGLNLSITLPFSLNKGNYFSYIDLSAKANYQQHANEVLGINRDAPQTFYSITNQISLGRNQRKSARDLYPKWGQNLLFSYKYDPPFSKTLGNNFYSIVGRFFIPGILKHHSLEINPSWYAGDVKFISYDKTYQYEYTASFLTNKYHFPICYPDKGVEGFIYVKRLKAELFNRYSINPNYLHSYGFTLFADVHLFRFFLPLFQIGTGMVYYPNESAKAFWSINYTL